MVLTSIIPVSPQVCVGVTSSDHGVLRHHEVFTSSLYANVSKGNVCFVYESRRSSSICFRFSLYINIDEVRLYFSRLFLKDKDKYWLTVSLIP